MEGNDVYKIYPMVVLASDMLAGGDFGFAALSDRLAIDASVQVVRDYRKRFFPVHQGFIHAPRQSPWRLKLLEIREQDRR